MLGDWNMTPGELAGTGFLQTVDGAVARTNAGSPPRGRDIDDAVLCRHRAAATKGGPRATDRHSVPHDTLLPQGYA